MKALLPLMFPLLLCLSGEVYFPTKWIIEGNTQIKTYCDGFNDGYPAGYKDVKGKYAICPVTPVCPVPEIDKNTYQDGYNEGFKQGSKDAKE